MKKRKKLTTPCTMAALLMACAVAGLTSCNQSELLLAENVDEAVESVHSEKYSSALRMASEAVEMLGAEGQTRSGQPRQVDEGATKYIVDYPVTRAEGEADTLMYVFNYTDDAGFAVISAVGEQPELVAVTEEGHFSSLDEVENTGFRMFMDASLCYVDSLRRSGSAVTRGGGQTGPEFIELDSIVVDTTIVQRTPLLSVRWGQREPFNSECPYDNGSQCPAGCVAIALAQILSYFEYPTSWTLLYASGIPTITVDWDVLKGYSSCSSCTSTTFCSTHAPLAKVIRQIGLSALTSYHASHSSSDLYKALIALNLWGFSTDAIDDYTYSYVRNSLWSDRPVLMGGKRIYTNASGKEETSNHAWVVDGFKEITYTYHEYTKPINMLSWTYQGSHSSSFRYNHINWGWKGDSNGYFSAGVFNTTRGAYDSGCSNVATCNYTQDLKIITNIRR